MQAPYLNCSAFSRFCDSLGCLAAGAGTNTSRTAKPRACRWMQAAASWQPRLNESWVNAVNPRTEQNRTCLPSVFFSARGIRVRSRWSRLWDDLVHKEILNWSWSSAHIPNRQSENILSRFVCRLLLHHHHHHHRILILRRSPLVGEPCVQGRHALSTFCARSYAKPQKWMRAYYLVTVLLLCIQKDSPSGQKKQSPMEKKSPGINSIVREGENIVHIFPWPTVP